MMEDGKIHHSSLLTLTSTLNLKSLNRAGSLFLRAILRRMKALGLNQSALARRMNVSRAYISKALSGDVNFSFSTACRFAKALGMDFMPGLAEKRGAKEGVACRKVGVRYAT